MRGRAARVKELTGGVASFRVRANSPASALLSREAGFSIRLVKKKRRTRGGRGKEEFTIHEI
jgi:hypothetical protein